MEENLLTVKEVAEKLKVTEYTVRERLSIPYIDLNEGKGRKRNMRFRVEDVENYLKKNKHYPIDIIKPNKKREYVS